MTIILNKDEHPVGTRFLEDLSMTPGRPHYAESVVVEWGTVVAAVKVKSGGDNPRWQRVESLTVLEILPPDQRSDTLAMRLYEAAGVTARSVRGEWVSAGDGERAVNAIKATEG